MGLFKKIKKAVKKTVKAVTKPVQKVGKKVIPFIPGVSMAVRKNHAYYKTPTAQDSAVSGPAQVIEPPDKDIADTENESSTESGKKKTRATGKKSLSVSRNSGGGLNI